MTMIIPNEEMLRACPDLHASLGRDYSATVADSKSAIKLADKLKVSYFLLDDIFYGFANRGWRKVEG